MANLEESHEAELDAILGELSALEQKSKYYILLHQFLIHDFNCI